MQDDRLKQAEDLFHAVVDLPEAKREALLSERCGRNALLRSFVEKLLRHHHETAGGVLDQLPTGDDFEAGDPIASPGQALGPYVLRERIGSGGMGEVWRAEQMSPVRRTVALKLIKPGMDSRQIIARFELERQALALMEHPGIATVYDARQTSEGRPYFAMELVSGVPITEYCDRNRLSTPERLDLFARVCEGVQHAHQKAVIHRDLKPSNILVAAVDGKPVPKIIDFGVAKATTQKLSERTMYTALGQVIGTPAYMSPEQAEMTGLDVDTRTDVYALGVLLYELLTGTLPFEATTLREAGLDEFRRIIREQEPPRPSTRIRTLGEGAPAAAANRRTDPGRWRRTLQHELDWIILKALEKDRNRRYETVSALAADVRRYLADEPVAAGPPSAVYRARKYLKRHRVSVGFAALITLAIATGFALMSIQNTRIASARDEAELVTATLEEMLASVDPTKSGRDVTVKEMLDETAKTLGEKLKDQPLIEARLRHTVGKTYDALGEFEPAIVHLKNVREIRGRVLGPDDPQTLEVQTDLGRTYLNLARYDDAETLLQEAMEISRRICGEEHPKTLHAMGVLAMVYLERGGRRAEAQALLRETLEISRRVLGEEHPQIVDYMNSLGISYRGSGRYDEAEVLLKQALGISRIAVGENHPLTLKVMTNLAENHRRRGNLDDAVTLLLEILETKRRVLGSEHRATLYAMHALAMTYSDMGRYDEASTLFLECLEIRRHIFGEEHLVTSDTMIQLLYVYARQGRHDEAESLSREASRLILDEDLALTNYGRYTLACALAMLGRNGDAISALREALNNGYLGPPNWPSILDDPDLDSLHGNPEFEAIVEELKRRNEDGQQ